MPRGDRARIALDHGDVTVHHLLVLVEMPRGDNDALGCPDSLALRAIFGNDARDAALSVLNKVGDRAAGAISMPRSSAPDSRAFKKPPP